MSKSHRQLARISDNAVERKAPKSNSQNTQLSAQADKDASDAANVARISETASKEDEKGVGRKTLGIFPCPICMYLSEARLGGRLGPQSALRLDWGHLLVYLFEAPRPIA